MGKKKSAICSTIKKKKNNNNLDIIKKLFSFFFLHLSPFKREGECGMFRENSIKTCISSRVKQITSPGWMHETSAQAWCTGKTQRDRVEREAGAGIGMGNTRKSMVDSCQCMTKTPTIL